MVNPVNFPELRVSAAVYVLVLLMQPLSNPDATMVIRFPI
jgi:hypothetical protein